MSVVGSCLNRYRIKKNSEFLTLDRVQGCALHCTDSCKEVMFCDSCSRAERVKIREEWKVQYETMEN